MVEEARDSVASTKITDFPTPKRPSGGGNGEFTWGERIAAIEAHMSHMATKQDISDLKALIEARESRLLKWMIGVAVGLAGVAIGAGFLFIRASGGG